jgi:hypothetical protein
MGVPFQCDLCSLRNVCRRQPVFQNRKDQFTLTCIRRIQLDIMWARELHTVASNWGRVKADYRDVVNNLSILPETLLPHLGNPELRDRVGMAAALATLVTSLHPGSNAATIQWDAIQKTRTWLSNAHDAGSRYTCKTVVGLDKTKQYVTSSHTFGKWFSHFMQGARLRMGMIRKQNEALTSNLVLAVCAKAEMKWSKAREETVKEDVENTVVFMLVTLGAGLRGKEVPLLSLEGLLTFWEETRAEEDRFVMLTLKGRFKGKVNKRWHLVPVSDFTWSGLPIRLWMERTLHRRVNVQRRTKGWLFQCPRGVRSKFGQYDNTFRLLIDLARDRHERLVPVVVETGDFSLWRSPRRGAVLEMTNQDVSEKVIELINRWRKKEGAKGLEVGLAMRQVYTQVKRTLPTMLRYSKAL